MTAAIRSPTEVIISTWKALFLRTAITRLAASRLAWFWLLVEPIAFIVVLMLVFTLLRVRHIGGINTAVWIMAGVLAFLMFRRIAAESMRVIKSSRKLFAHSQIRPIDPVLVNAALEGFLMVLISITLLTGVWFFGLDIVPADPLAVIEALFGLWLLGVGFGLVTSVAIELAPPVGAVLGFTLRPLYFLSGVIFPVTLTPYPYRDWFLLNPLVHGLEAVRLGFAPYYHVPSELSLTYLYGWAGVSIFFGLALHVRYASKLLLRHDNP